MSFSGYIITQIYIFFLLSMSIIWDTWPVGGLNWEKILCVVHGGNANEVYLYIYLFKVGGMVVYV